MLMIVCLDGLAYAQAGEFVLLVDWSKIRGHEDNDTIWLLSGTDSDAVRLVHWDDVAHFPEVYDALVDHRTTKPFLDLRDHPDKEAIALVSRTLESYFDSEGARPIELQFDDLGVAIYIDNFAVSAVVPHEVLLKEETAG